MLRVIDTSVYQKDLVVAAVNADAFIVKATGGVGYVNPDCDDTIQQAIALNKPFGFYHYFSDGFNDGDPIAEANFFVDNCLGYFHHGIPVLDWERGGNPDVGNTGKALAFLQHVEARTGVKPLIYMSLSLITSLNWSAVIAGNFGLWCAAYVDNNTPIPNFSMDPNRDPNPHWDGNVNDVLWQFTSTGRIDGYGGNLDCSFFYGPRAAWDAYAGVSQPAPAPAPTPTPEPTPTPPAPTPEPTPAPEPAPTPTPPPVGVPNPPEPDPSPGVPTPPDSPPDTSPPVETGPPETPPPADGSGGQVQGPSLWVAIWEFIKAFFNKLRGV